MLEYFETAYDDICDKILAKFGAIDGLETVVFIDGDTAQKKYNYPYIEFDLGDIKTNEKAKQGAHIASITFEAILCAKSGPSRNRDITKLGLKIVSMLNDGTNGLGSYDIHLMPNYFKSAGQSVQHQGEASRQLYFTIDIKIAETNLLNIGLDYEPIAEP